MGKSSLWSFTIPDEDDMICNKYGKCTTPLYEYLFSNLDVRFPFTAFEVGVLNYLMAAPSQLHLSGWEYMKVYQFWCEHLKGKPSIVLFFHLFYFNWGTSTWYKEWGLVFLVPKIQIFKDFPSMMPFLDQFFFVTTLHRLAHVTICRFESRVEGKCEPLFCHCWSLNHFFLENNTYSYKEGYFSVEVYF